MDQNFRTPKNILAGVLPEGAPVLVSFSRGKDSLATWVVCRECGYRVVPFHMDLVPGLRFVEHSLRYYEDFFQTHIYRTIHPSLYVWLNTLCSQPPGRKAALDLLDLPHYDYPDVAAGVARTAGLGKDFWQAVGARKADSFMRAKRLPDDGVNPTSRNVYPLLHFKKADVVAALQRAGVKLPVDYEWFGRSFDGMDYRFLSVIREKAPDDYRTILDWFPMQVMELKRREVAVKHGQAR